MDTENKSEPKGHEHLWDKWYPLDNMHKRRVCLDPNCREVEKKKVI